MAWTAPAREASVQRDPNPPFSHTAPHIRGRVFHSGRTVRGGGAMWAMEIVNAATGDVIVTDNCADLERLLRECHEATAVARGTWFFSLSKKAVRE
jgi:hypothetical protein